MTNRKEYMKGYRKRNKEEIKEYNQEYQQKNKNKLKIYHKEYGKEYRKRQYAKQKHRESTKEFYKKYKDKIRTKAREQYKKPEVKKHHKEYREKNKEKIKVNVRAYRQQLENKVRYREYNKRYNQNNKAEAKVLRMTNTCVDCGKKIGKNATRCNVCARAKKILPLKDTSIEIKIQNYLKELGIPFFTHQYMKEIEHGYQCDILIPSLNLVIETDGDYWHKYPIGRNIDKIRTDELIEKGFKVLRLWECEIKKLGLDEFEVMIR